MLHVLRLAHLRNAKARPAHKSSSSRDSHSTRVISLSAQTLSSNPYVYASELADLDAWPEIASGLDSPRLSFEDELTGEVKAVKTRHRARSDEEPSRSYSQRDPSVSLQYSKTLGKRSHIGLGDGVTTQALRQDSASSSRTISADETPSRSYRPGALRERVRSSTVSSPPDATPSSRRPATSLASLAMTPSSSDKTPVAKLLGPITAAEHLKANRPRADSAPMVVVSSPKRSMSSPVTPGRTPRQSVDSYVSLNDDAPPALTRRVTSSTQRDSRRPDFDSSAVKAAAAMGIDLEKDGETGIPAPPPPGADPREWARNQMQVGSILHQALNVGASLRSSTAMDSPLHESPAESFGATTTSGYEDETTDGPSGISAGRILNGGFTVASPLKGSLSSEQSSSESHLEGRADSSEVEQPTLTFEKVGSPAPARAGGLSMLFAPAPAAAPSTSQNPLASAYASVPHPENSSLPSSRLSIYYPFSDKPGDHIEITVRRDVKIEEVIGWSLAQYIEQKRTPALQARRVEGENADFEDEVWLSTAGWALKMVEDDGEVDEDFPALDRDSALSKFNFDAFAVVEASAAQIRQNLAKMPVRPKQTPQLQQQPSFSSANNSPEKSTASSIGPSSTMRLGQTLADAPFAGGGVPGSVSSSTMGGVMVQLRVRIVTGPSVHFTTTINVPSEMYFADIIEVLTERKRLDPPQPSEWVLVLADLSMVLPLDRTVESLMGSVDLALVRKSWAESRGLKTGGKNGERRGGDPNGEHDGSKQSRYTLTALCAASIFKRRSEQPKGAAGQADFTSTYRKFLVQRKMPIGKHERILAIDGDYIHVRRAILPRGIG